MSAFRFLAIGFFTAMGVFLAALIMLLAIASYGAKINKKKKKKSKEEMMKAFDDFKKGL